MEEEEYFLGFIIVAIELCGVGSLRFFYFCLMAISDMPDVD